jgi:hypothetical protein
MPGCSAYSGMYPEVACWELQFRNYPELWSSWWIFGWKVWNKGWWMIDCTLGSDSFFGGKSVKWEALQDIAIVAA